VKTPNKNGGANRTLILAGIGIVLVVVLALGLAYAANLQAGRPAPAVTATATAIVSPPTPDLRPSATPLPPTVGTPAGTPLPTPELGPSPTPQPTLVQPSSVGVQAPTVTVWVQFPGKQSKVTFDYPAGWTVVESAVVAPAYSPDPQVTISIANYDIAKAPARSGLPSGAVKIDIISSKDALQPLAEPFTVGPLNYPGSRIQRDKGVSADIPPGVERSISINFTAGKRNWVILGNFAEPKTLSDQNTSVFYQIVGSVRYAGN
jgi:hypothetical protein